MNFRGGKEKRANPKNASYSFRLNFSFRRNEG